MLKELFEKASARQRISTNYMSIFSDSREVKEGQCTEEGVREVLGIEDFNPDACMIRTRAKDKLQKAKYRTDTEDHKACYYVVDTWWKRDTWWKSPSKKPPVIYRYFWHPGVSMLILKEYVIVKLIDTYYAIYLGKDDPLNVDICVETIYVRDTGIYINAYGDKDQKVIARQKGSKVTIRDQDLCDGLQREAKELFEALSA